MLENRYGGKLILSIKKKISKTVVLIISFVLLITQSIFISPDIVFAADSPIIITNL